MRCETRNAIDSWQEGKRCLSLPPRHFFIITHHQIYLIIAIKWLIDRLIDYFSSFHNACILLNGDIEIVFAKLILMHLMRWKFKNNFFLVNLSIPFFPPLVSLFFNKSLLPITSLVFLFFCCDKALLFFSFLFSLRIKLIFDLFFFHSWEGQGQRAARS